MWFFNCTGVGASNPSIVQRSTVRSFGLLMLKTSSNCNFREVNSTFFSLPRLPGHPTIAENVKVCLQWNWPQIWGTWLYVWGGELVRKRWGGVWLSQFGKELSCQQRKTWNFIRLHILFLEIVLDSPSSGQAFLAALAQQLIPINWRSRISLWES